MTKKTKTKTQKTQKTQPETSATLLALPRRQVIPVEPQPVCFDDRGDMQRWVWGPKAPVLDDMGDLENGTSTDSWWDSGDNEASMMGDRAQNDPGRFLELAGRVAPGSTIECHYITVRATTNDSTLCWCWVVTAPKQAEPTKPPPKCAPLMKRLQGMRMYLHSYPADSDLQSVLNMARKLFGQVNVLSESKQWTVEVVDLRGEAARLDSGRSWDGTRPTIRGALTSLINTWIDEERKGLA